MQKRATRRAPTAALALLMILAACGTAAAQDEGGPQRTRARNDTNHEVQLHLLVTSSAQEDGQRVPAALEGVVRQLRASLPATDFRLAATFINRVKDGGALEVKSLGGGPLGHATADAMRPTFFQFALADVRLEEDAAGQNSINIRQFRLGLKVPVVTGNAAAEKTPNSYPVVQYEDTGINTQLSVREGEPTLVGTLGTSRPGQLFVLVITVKRATK